MRKTSRLLGRSQAERHRNLDPAFKGSNPFAPENLEVSYQLKSEEKKPPIFLFMFWQKTRKEAHAVLSWKTSRSLPFFQSKPIMLAFFCQRKHPHRMSKFSINGSQKNDNRLLPFYQAIRFSKKRTLYRKKTPLTFFLF